MMSRILLLGCFSILVCVTSCVDKRYKMEEEKAKSLGIDQTRNDENIQIDVERIREGMLLLSKGDTIKKVKSILGEPTDQYAMMAKEGPIVLGYCLSYKIRCDDKPEDYLKIYFDTDGKLLMELYK